MRKRKQKEGDDDELGGRSLNRRGIIKRVGGLPQHIQWQQQATRLGVL